MEIFPFLSNLFSFQSKKINLPLEDSVYTKVVVIKHWRCTKTGNEWSGPEIEKLGNSPECLTHSSKHHICID
jgi:hypothetical protein